MGVKVGAIDSIEPAGDRMKVNFHFDSQYKGARRGHRVDPEPHRRGLPRSATGSAVLGVPR